ncbi:MAG: DUF3800 domain-containing protein [Prevotellaceae bacterium]|jgi:hypothetical protein|nr:DUF3800 domain-containing protein [Prevotellaceae bacterium]
MKYFLFIDECGDPCLANFDVSFPAFTLCGILVSEPDYFKMTAEVTEMKQKYWTDKQVILHSRDIRKCEKGFEILFNPDIKQSFYESLNVIMKENHYVIVSCSILKEPYTKEYGCFGDIYAQSLLDIIEKTVSFLDEQGDKNIELQVCAEQRGKKEDALLFKFYNEVLARGTYSIKPEKIQQYFNCFEFKNKKENIIGLQMADLVAYPITRYVLNKNAINPAFAIIEPKIYVTKKELL